MVRTLVTELLLLGAGAVTGIAAFEQFCVFAAVAVIVDFALHITFFLTVLSIDIRRLEVCVHSRPGYH